MSKSAELKQYIIDTVRAETQGMNPTKTDMPFEERIKQMGMRLQGVSPPNEKIGVVGQFQNEK